MSVLKKIKSRSAHEKSVFERVHVWTVMVKSSIIFITEAPFQSPKQALHLSVGASLSSTVRMHDLNPTFD